MKRALVFGGTGAIGRQVLQQFSELGIVSDFTYFQNTQFAKELEDKYGHRSHELDLAKNTNIRQLIKELVEKEHIPDIVVHCAAIVENKTIYETTEDLWQKTMSVNCWSIFIACQELCPFMEKKGGDIILLGTLDRTQSLPIPVYFSATQGAISAMTMALAKELGSKGIRINMVVPGLLGEGASLALDSKTQKDFQNYNSLKRLGSTEEVARAILWIALENNYMNGKVVPVNGGI